MPLCQTLKCASPGASVFGRICRSPRVPDSSFLDVCRNVRATFWRMGKIPLDLLPKRKERLSESIKENSGENCSRHLKILQAIFTYSPHAKTLFKARGVFRSLENFSPNFSSTDSNGSSFPCICLFPIF